MNEGAEEKKAGNLMEFKTERIDQNLKSFILIFSSKWN